MQYAPVSRLTIEQVVASLNSDRPDIVCQAILSASLYHSDWRESQSICLQQLQRNDRDVQKCSIVALGNIVRIHGIIDIAVVRSTLSKLNPDKEMSEYIDNFWSDVNVFYQNPVLKDSPN